MISKKTAWAATGQWKRYRTGYYYQMMKKRPRFTSYSLETVVSNSFISSKKARTELAYQPRSMYETLSDTVAWWLENRHRVKASLRG